ncbi:SDR family NAD(P)-dependent oxidoreductase [Lichenibacterium minor]|uniref:SDR family NAD(P)-dependent oxidoreductase n=1 Tax=Lichenibacterium minor TaxID=2316528 RepID=A0A4Q2U9I5_9HYPH|nr:SDR family NAD(P)-dependent oxidoreductase [Lichenibacterium minor]RYC31821.1 SDR family NAD(P)-dependent oxidoreductase [Lichenibacterium minor]
MAELVGTIAWVTGAGSGIGEASALALAGAGATLVLTGRRAEPLDAVAARITAAGGTALALPGDLTRPETAGEIVAETVRRFGRLDILVNNAGLNIAARAWRDLTPGSIDTVLGGNLSAAFYCSAAALPPMRRQRGGVLIHTASWAGKYISPVSGPAYTAAKHAVVAMSQSINMEEYRDGIRSTAVLPAEVATPILDRRPVPPNADERAAMLQPEDLGALVLFIATRPPGVCLNEVTISPTMNRMYGT